MYEAVISVLSNAVDNWTEFDAWCLKHSFDPLEVPCRRLVAAAWAFLTENMDPETKDQLIYDLTVKDPTKEVRKTISSTLPDDEKTKSVPSAKWRAPEGWKPPGWNEEKSYQTAMKFMGFNANPK